MSILDKKHIKKFICIHCDYKTNISTNWIKHTNTIKHKVNAEGINKPIKENIKKIHCCKECNYETTFKSDFNKHIKSKKHLININAYEANKIEELVNSMPEEEVKKALINKLVTNNTNTNNANAQNIITNNNSYNNCNNKNIQINVVLDKNCPDALNFQDFIAGITVTVNDLIEATDKGYIDGIGGFLKDKLNELDPSLRPIHCSNKKKLEFYVKDEDKWEINQDKVSKGISTLSSKHAGMIKKWCKENEGWMDTDNGLELYHKMVQTLIGGINGDNKIRNIKGVKREIRDEVSINEVIDLNNNNNE